MKIDKNNYLFVVLFAIVLISMINKSDNYFSTFVFSLAPILLYLYQINFRMSLRVAYTFLFPSIVFLLFLVSETKNNALIPSRERRYRKGLCVLSSILIIASFGIACAWVCCNYYPGLSEEYNLQLRTYMESYQDTVFVCDIHSNSLVDKGYHNAALKPDIPKNEIVTTGWIMITDYYSNTLL